MKCYWVSIRTRKRNGVVSYGFLLVLGGVCFAKDGIPLKSLVSNFQGHRREQFTITTKEISIQKDNTFVSTNSNSDLHCDSDKQDFESYLASVY